MQRSLPIALTESVARWDEDVFRVVNTFARENKGNEFDFLMRAASEWGAGYSVLFVAVAVALASRSSARLHACMRRLLASQILAAIAIRTLKHTIGRERPARHLSEAFADGSLAKVFDLKASLGSMPSGHSTTIWCLVAVLLFFARDLPSRWRWTFGLAAACIAALASYARVYAGVHFPSDVIVGAVLGVCVALVSLWLIGRIESTRRHAPTPNETVA